MILKLFKKIPVLYVSRRPVTDPNNVGKWVHNNMVFSVNGPKYYYLIIGVISKDTYSVRGYEDGENKYSKLDTRSFDVNEITIIPATDVPQEIRNMAAQDYPNIAPSGFTVSSGTWWIIAAGAVVIVGGVVAIIVANKKKPAVADGAEITDNTEKPEE